MPITTKSTVNNAKPTTALKYQPLPLGSQYYRPPTPRPEDWAVDLKRMKEAGLDTIQL